MCVIISSFPLLPTQRPPPPPPHTHTHTHIVVVPYEYPDSWPPPPWVCGQLTACPPPIWRVSRYPYNSHHPPPPPPIWWVSGRTADGMARPGFSRPWSLHGSGGRASFLLEDYLLTLWTRSGQSTQPVGQHLWELIMDRGREDWVRSVN